MDGDPEELRTSIQLCNAPLSISDEKACLYGNTIILTSATWQSARPLNFEDSILASNPKDLSEFRTLGIKTIHLRHLRTFQNHKPGCLASEKYTRP
ncbi:MAG: hypothetical protein HS132_02720 [Planctomycetia bacterium]|nr:hypothetical protein [Planctomycetia bacterium]